MSYAMVGFAWNDRKVTFSSGANNPN